MSWSTQDTWLVVWAALSIAVIIVLITWLKVHAFIALIVGSGVG